MKKNIGFFISFCIAKGMVFLAPILLADILTERDFGVLEYALAGVGMLINAFISLGVSGAYPYYILKQKNFEIKPGFALHPIWLLLFFLVNQILFYAFSLYTIEIYMAVNISYIIANQQFFSTKFKSHENIFKAVFLDAGIYILLMIFIILYLLKLMPLNVDNINKGIFIYALFFGAYGVYDLIKTKKERIFTYYKKILKFSFHLLISSSFLFLLSVSGRILTKHFFDYETTGVYGFYFRLAAIVVMIYQVISIRFFKDIYTVVPEKLDKYFSTFYLFIFSLSVVIYIITPYIVPHFSVFFSETYIENKTVFFIIFCQMTMWIATALNSNIVDREGLAKKNNFYYLALLIISIIILYLMRDQMTLLRLTFILYSIFFLANLSQFLVLYLKKIIFKKSMISLIIIYIISCITLYFIA
ncbi:MAG: hypothetical protein JXQ93_08475 [Flavobacteriaceae bacterium]